MRFHTAKSQEALDPEEALQYLIEGNLRFQNNLKADRDLLQQVNESSRNQFPFATILSCIDSRTSAELIFDQGLGDIFSIRIAGNIINDDILGSMEFACEVAGSKLIVVLGHTHCGAIHAACEGQGSGHIAHLIKNIQPAVLAAKQMGQDVAEMDEFPDKVAMVNVHMSIEKIREESHALASLEQDGKIKITGGLYDVSNGVVTFFH